MFLEVCREGVVLGRVMVESSAMMVRGERLEVVVMVVSNNSGALRCRKDTA